MPRGLLYPVAIILNEVGLGGEARPAGNLMNARETAKQILLNRRFEGHGFTGC